MLHVQQIQGTQIEHELGLKHKRSQLFDPTTSYQAKEQLLE